MRKSLFLIIAIAGVLLASCGYLSPCNTHFINNSSKVVTVKAKCPLSGEVDSFPLNPGDSITFTHPSGFSVPLWGGSSGYYDDVEYSHEPDFPTVRVDKQGWWPDLTIVFT